ncbi:MAG: hypothetical protein L6U16_03760 [Porphyromonadaceae bacterium]|nr:MAG: hypothetical protein L6U16_03760 [Porphyromonadaceae bacterium]
MKKIPINIIFGDGGVAKAPSKKHHQRDGSFDGVCYNVLSVRMLELIFVA